MITTNVGNFHEWTGWNCPLKNKARAAYWSGTLEAASPLGGGTLETPSEFCARLCYPYNRCHYRSRNLLRNRGTNQIALCNRVTLSLVLCCF